MFFIRADKFLHDGYYFTTTLQLRLHHMYHPSEQRDSKGPSGILILLNLKYCKFPHSTNPRIMHAPESIWFEIAIVSIIFAVGNILFGHFEERTPKLKRLGKYILVTILTCSLSVYLSRTAAFIALGVFLIPVLYIHAYFLPRKKGINGWSGEPKSKYYDFRGWSKDIFVD